MALDRLFLGSIEIRMFRAVLVPLAVLAPEPDSHENRENKAHRKRSDQGTVPATIAWSVLRLIDEAGYDSSQIAEAHVHRYPNTTLGRSSYVVPIPGNSLGDVRIDAGSSEKSTHILYPWIVRCNKQDETSDAVQTLQ